MYCVVAASELPFASVRPTSSVSFGSPKALKFWTVYSYLVVYDPDSRPLTIVAVLHGARDVEQLLKPT